MPMTSMVLVSSALLSAVASLKYLQRDVLEERLLAPVLVVALEGDRVAAGPLLEREGPGADGLGGELVDRRLGHHRAHAGGHLVEPVVARLGQGHLSWVSETALASLTTSIAVFSEIVQSFLTRLMENAGVLGRERLPVAEGGVVDEVEGVGLAVAGDGPLLRQGGHDLRPPGRPSPASRRRCTSRACGMAAPSVVVKSRLAGSATSPTLRVVSPPLPPPEDAPGLLLDPAEQALARRHSAAPVAARRVSFTVSPSRPGPRRPAAQCWPGHRGRVCGWRG